MKAAGSRAKASTTRLLTASQDPRAGSKLDLDEIQVSLEMLNIVMKELESISGQIAIFDEEEGYVDPAIDPQYGKAKRSSHALVSIKANTCVICNSLDHKIYACSKFDELSIEQRRTFV